MTTTNEEYKPSEDQIAEAFVDYIANKYPDLKRCLIKIDNENKCSLAEGAKKKRQGKLKGASDYFLAHPVMHVSQEAQYLYCGFFLELKKHNGKETSEQKEFGSRMVSKGYCYACAHSIEEAIQDLEDYLRI